jgi:hypothetical protein
MTAPTMREIAREIVDRYQIKDTLCVPDHCIADEIEAFGNQIRERTIDEAAEIVKTWHIKKGGYGILEEEILKLKGKS